MPQNDTDTTFYPFRFFPGERVFVTQWPGITGTVQEGYPAAIYVKWDKRCEGFYTAFPANWEISRIKDDTDK